MSSTGVARDNARTSNKAEGGKEKKKVKMKNDGRRKEVMSAMEWKRIEARETKEKDVAGGGV